MPLNVIFTVRDRAVLADFVGRYKKSADNIFINMI